MNYSTTEATITKDGEILNKHSHVVDFILNDEMIDQIVDKVISKIHSGIECSKINDSNKR